MKNGVKTGVFLCGCGKVIADRLDLPSLEKMVQGAEGVATVQSGPRYCLRPGLNALAETIETHGLNRVIVGACSDRIMKQKISNALKKFDFLDSQIEMVNLKDHIALVHDEPRDELTRKAAALLGGAAASLKLLNPVTVPQDSLRGPAVILGGGISGFAAARELAMNGMKTVMVSGYGSPDQVLESLPTRYPGARAHFGFLKPMLEDVFSNSMVEHITDGPLDYLDGHIGDFRLGFQFPDGQAREIRASVIIVAFDREFAAGEESMSNPPRYMDQVEFEDLLGREEEIAGNVLFWINAPGGNREREIAIQSAWDNSRYLAERFPAARPVILYPEDAPMPLSDRDLAAARKQQIRIQAYDPGFAPTVRSDHVTFIKSGDRIKHEIGWDILVSSALPGPPDPKIAELSRVLPILSARAGLKGPHLKLKAEQEPIERFLLAGSAKEPLSLDEALFDGKAVAGKALRLRKKADQASKARFTVVSVNQDMCEGCGLCEEVCTCGAVENIRPGKGPLPRKIDSHACDGSGSCAAACPYQAMTVLNNSAQQLDARIEAVLSGMRENDVLGLACGWGGQGAAEMAAIKGLKYPSRFFMLSVKCLGSIDPATISMAFLKGANHVLLAGCTPSASCHYGYGIDHTWFRMLFIEKLLSLAGIERQRICLSYMNVNEPEVFVRTVGSFLEDAKRLGPIERTPQRQERLLAVHATLLHPRVRWVLGVGLRRPSETDFPNIQNQQLALEELFTDVLEEEYLTARIMRVLGEGPSNPPQIARALDEPVQRISRLLTDLAGEKRLVHKGIKDGYLAFGIAGGGLMRRPLQKASLNG